MNRWLASRWMVIGFALCCMAFALDWFRDTNAFVVVAPAFLGLGGVKQWRDVRRRQLGEDPLSHMEGQ